MSTEGQLPAVAITGGTINSTAIGATAPSTGAFITITAAISSSSPPTDNGAVGSATGGTLTAKQIYDWAFCNLCATNYAYDGVRGVGILSSGSTQPLSNGIAGYVESKTATGGDSLVPNIHA